MTAPQGPPDAVPGPEQPLVRRSPVLDASVRLVFHTVLVFGLYLLFAGHNQPGGGFVGGLVCGTAFVLRYAARGREGIRSAVPLDPGVPLGLGIVLTASTGAAPLLAGADLLRSGFHELTLPVLGHVKLTSVLVFDTGVFLVVVGVVLALLRTLGAEAER